MLQAPQKPEAFRRRLISWYARHARILPWRSSGAATVDPYRVWVSEIMLQQTTTQTVQGYFDRFIEKFPTVKALAEAELDQVQRLWEGLGYYRRCAQMHRAAREIIERFGGVFPDTAEKIRSLPGIGRYTAGAIASIAFDRREPILEANTLRLHARLMGLRTDPAERTANEMLWDFAQKILPAKNPGRFNQALMDLGSLICTAQSPRCDACPVTGFCETFRLGLQTTIPYKPAKAAKIDRTEVALWVKRGKKILVMRYPQHGRKGVRWAGFWDFPRAELNDGPETAALEAALSRMTGRKLSAGPVITTMKHSVTCYRITLQFREGHDGGKMPQAGQYETRWVTAEELQDMPLHSTARKLASLSDIRAGSATK